MQLPLRMTLARQPLSNLQKRQLHSVSNSFQQWRSSAQQTQNMASATKIHLSVNDTGIVKFKPQNEETARKTSELLQYNHDNHHAFFNDHGFHNHIVHHLLTLYGLGAPAATIEKHYRDNESYQQPAVAVHSAALHAMQSSKDNLPAYLGRAEHYHDFLLYYQGEIAAKGVEAVLAESLFAGDEAADDLLARMFAGLFHPVIHLGFGLEFAQPAVVAEALAQGSVHGEYMKNFFLEAERAARGGSGDVARTLPELVTEIGANERMRDASRWEDGDKLREGILKRAFAESVKYTSQWIATPETIEEKTAEMINTVVYFTAASQHPPKQIKFDFFYMHSLNSSLFFSLFTRLPSIPIPTRIRLLEWKARADLITYESGKHPPLLLDEITSYTPQQRRATSESADALDAETAFAPLVRRVFAMPDDGHALKLLRALRHGQLVCRPFEGDGAGPPKPWCVIRGGLWEKVQHMAVDSVESGGAEWVRSCGFEEAWEDFEDRPARA